MPKQPNVKLPKRILPRITGPPDLQVGDRVRLNVKQIKSASDYERRLPAYKEFVETHTSSSFIISRVRRSSDDTMCIVELEDTIWWFWSGEVKKIHNQSRKTLS